MSAPAAEPMATAGRVGAFFSGGVASFFTLLRTDAGGADGRTVDDLITVWGFDVPPSKPEAYARMSVSLRQAPSVWASE